MVFTREAQHENIRSPFSVLALILLPLTACTDNINGSDINAENAPGKRINPGAAQRE